MQDLLSNINLRVNESTYLKDPKSSDLGIRIVTGSIDLIDNVGFEHFTFKKLASAIKSTEASVYRYFESKHKLLLYLTDWYWSWMEYRLVFSLANIEDPEERLHKAIGLLTQVVEEDGDFTHIDELKLDRIVVAESSKAYLTRAVDDENKHGAFTGYKRLVARIGEIVKEINPEYKYPHMLISTVIESAHHQRFFAAHLPRLTDQVKGEDSISEFCSEIAFKSIRK